VIRPLGRAQYFTGVSRGYFPGRHIEIVNRCRRHLSGQTTDQTRVSVQQVLNSWSDCWIELEFLQEFTEAVFPSISKISLLDANGVSSGHSTDQTTVPVNMSITLDPAVGSCSNFYRSFRRLFSLTLQWNRFSMPPTSGRATPPTKPEYRLKKSVTLDLTVGSCLIFYKSF